MRSILEIEASMTNGACIFHERKKYLFFSCRPGEFSVYGICLFVMLLMQHRQLILLVRRSGNLESDMTSMKRKKLLFPLLCYASIEKENMDRKKSPKETLKRPFFSCARSSMDGKVPSFLA